MAINLTGGSQEQPGGNSFTPTSPWLTYNQGQTPGSQDGNYNFDPWYMYTNSIYPKSQSSSGASNFSNSFSGIEGYSPPVDQLKESVDNYLPNIEKWQNQSLGTLRSGVQEGIKDPINQAINNLASRNVLTSSVASDTISKVLKNLTGQATGQAGNIANTTFQAKANMPSMLGQLVDMGRTSEASGGGSSSSVSSNSDPLAPFTEMNRMLTQVM